MPPRLIPRMLLAAVLFLPAGASVRAASSRPASCTSVELTGMVNSGDDWDTPIGEGWVFRIIPIAPASTGYMGWDLVVDRDPPAGYPDALLLATLPYNALNPREIGTTFGLRAQDAIGWSPRRFHFLTDPSAFAAGQKLFLALARPSQTQSGASAKAGAAPSVAQLNRRLDRLRAGASAGEFNILDAGLAPGAGNPAPYARNWALQASQTSYALVAESSATPTARGELDWIRFSVTLWLPSGWKLPPGLDLASAPCRN